MNVRLEGLGKRFGYRWIFRNMDFTFGPTGIYGIAGRNGSGKSTLLKIISGLLSSSDGEVFYDHNDQPVERSEIYKHIGFAAPYFELIEELSLKEYFSFFLKSSKTDSIDQLDDWIKESGLENEKDKSLMNYSSGMKQRVKLATALFSKRDIVLLDEPSSNLDAEAYSWFKEIVIDKSRDRLIIIASNDPQDFIDVKEEIRLEDYK